MKRKVHKDERGLWVSAGGWCIRPRLHQSRFNEGDTVIITSVDPVAAAFGKVRLAVEGSSVVERWAIFNSEWVFNGKPTRDSQAATKFHSRKAERRHYAGGTT